jgi:hypothetical protein
MRQGGSNENTESPLTVSSEDIDNENRLNHCETPEPTSHQSSVIIVADVNDDTTPEDRDLDQHPSQGLYGGDDLENRGILITSEQKKTGSLMPLDDAAVVESQEVEEEEKKMESFEGPPMSPTRSFLSSIDCSQSVHRMHDNEEGVGDVDENPNVQEHDIEDDKSMPSLLYPSMGIGGGGPSVVLFNDEKSIRSELTRPDPPSIIDGTLEEDQEQQNQAISNNNDSSFHCTSFMIDPNNPFEKKTVIYSGEEMDKFPHRIGDEPEEETTADQIQPQETEDEQVVDNSSHNVPISVQHETLQPTPSTSLEREQQQNSDEDSNTFLPPVLPYTLTGADNLVLLPRVDEHHISPDPKTAADLLPRTSSAFSIQQQQQELQHPSSSSSFHPPVSTISGRRKIRLRVQEDVLSKHSRTRSLLGSIKKSSMTRMLRFKSLTMQDYDDLHQSSRTLYKSVDRGTLTISWYDGTSSLDLQQHVRRSVIRKLKLEDEDIELEDIRILDETTDPPEEIVLSPYIPNGSQFLLRFSTKTNNNKKKHSNNEEYGDGTTTPTSQWSYGRPPVSPSAAPSPHPEREIIRRLNANQLALLHNLRIPAERSSSGSKKKQQHLIATEAENDKQEQHPLLRDRNATKDEINDETSTKLSMGDAVPRTPPPSSHDVQDEDEDAHDDDDDDEDDMMLHSEDPVEARLREITELLISDRKKRRESRKGEKRQVIFVVANYFVLFLALIALFSEIQARAPHWLKMMEEHLQSVQNCSENQEALFECVSRGDLAGLIASVLLWMSRSVATRRIFLFGFETPKKLWTVVYESLVTSVCWGISYLFIRRGMNPDTRPRFVQKYWKDAVYGSLAGFNAAFLKQILKNLIPQEVVEDALRERHLNFLRWLPSFAYYS